MRPSGNLKMKPILPPNWSLTVLPAEGPRGRLRIYTPAGHAVWNSIACDIWTGNFQGLEKIPASPYAEVYHGMLPDPPTPFFFKRFLKRDAWDALKDLLRPSRAARALSGSLLAETHGFRAPVPLCLIEEHRFGILVASGLITRTIEHVHKVQELINRPLLNLTPPTPQKRALLRAMGREVGRWQHAGLYHGDLRTSNLLCRFEHDRPILFWIDHERTRTYAGLPFGRRVHNLMQVNMEKDGWSRTDRLRVWKAYLETEPIPEADRPALLQAVIAKTRKRWKKRGWL